MFELITEAMGWILLLGGFFTLGVFFVRVYDSTRHSRHMFKEDIESMKTMFDLENALKDVGLSEITWDLAKEGEDCSKCVIYNSENKPGIHLPSPLDDNLENGRLPEVGTDDDGRRRMK